MAGPPQLDAKSGDASNEASRISRAFTLVELLVVIAIIAILASLLLPAISRGKAAAQGARCQTNLRQINVAVIMYVGEYGRYPSVYRPISSNLPAGAKWYDDLQPYTLSAWTNGLYRCPTYNGRVNDGRPAVTGFTASVGSYGINVGTCDKTGQMQFGLFSQNHLSDLPKLESTVRVPSEMIALSDGFAVWNEPTLTLLFEGFELTSRKLRQYRLQTEIADQDRGRRRHAGKLNVALSDGHVEKIGFSELFLEMNPRSLRRWHIDNEPHLELFR